MRDIDSICLENYPKRVRCPECGAVLKCMVVFGADQTMSGDTERLYHCGMCLSSWETSESVNDGSVKIKRYFFG